MTTASWFANLNPASRTPVRVSISVGQSAPAGVLDAALKDFAALEQTVFVPRVHDMKGTFEIAPRFDDSFWDGPPSQTVTTSGYMADWSPEATGWYAEALSECLAARGLASPMLLSVAME